LHAVGVELGDVVDAAGPGSDGVEHCEINTVHIAQNQIQSQAPDHRTRLGAALQTLGVLAELFPAAFVAERWKPHKPLKIGIRDDLIATGLLTPSECKAALRLYIVRLQYQKALAAGGPRVDLDGIVVGEVASDQAEHAGAVVVHLEAPSIAKAESARAKKAERKRAAKEKPDPKAPPSDSATPRRLGLADLKRAAAARKGVPS
jgi:sRNA-binding protein